MSEENKEDELSSPSKDERRQEALKLIEKMKTLITHQILLDKYKREFLDKLSAFVKKHNSIPRELVRAREKLFPGSGENPRYSKSLSADK